MHRFYHWVEHSAACLAAESRIWQFALVSLLTGPGLSLITSKQDRGEKMIHTSTPVGVVRCAARWICGWSCWLSTSLSNAVTFSSLCARRVCCCWAFGRWNLEKVIFRKVGSVATPFRCGGICNESFYCKFPDEYNSERILTIGRHLAKTCAKVWCIVFLTHDVITFEVTQPTCIWPQITNVTDRQTDRHTDRWTDGRTNRQHTIQNYLASSITRIS